MVTLKPKTGPVDDEYTLAVLKDSQEEYMYEIQDEATGQTLFLTEQQMAELRLDDDSGESDE